jgi:D-alanyl-D-alanine dipeptidase
MRLSPISFVVRRRLALLAGPLTLITACHGAVGAPASNVAPATSLSSGEVAPPAPPAALLPLLGEYGRDSSVVIVLERDGHLRMHLPDVEIPLADRPDWSVPSKVDRTSTVFHRDASGAVTALVLDNVALPRRQIGPASGNQLVITPVRPIDELRREALAATPPVERGPFLPSDLVELVRLDPTIHLEIRYATSNNLFGTPFYSQARAFLQRPAAEALVRANAKLRQRGYGVLVHDGYRPWYVTKMFWDASPVEKHIFVADPAQGSKHNRGAAVDLTLYELATGNPVEMVSTYDETSPRAYPDYPGGTSRQRWHRALLRRAMEAEGFSVYEAEWWHFDFADWKRYPIGNTVFEQISAR